MPPVVLAIAGVIEAIGISAPIASAVASGITEPEENTIEGWPEVLNDARN